MKAYKPAVPPDQGFRNLWRFMGFTRRYWKYLAGASITGLLRMILNLSLPYFLKHVIDDVVMAHTAPAVRFHLLWSYIAYLLVIMAFHIPWTYGRWFLAQVVAAHAIRDIRFILFDRLQRLSLAFHIQRPTGAVISRMMNDVTTAQNAFDVLFIQVFQNLLNASVAATVMLRHDWQWALVAFSTLPIFMVTTRLVARPIRRASRQMMETVSDISGLMHERMAMIREVQSFTAEVYEKRQVRREVERLKQYTLRQQWLNSFLIAASEITRHLGWVAVVAFGAYRVYHGDAKVGDLSMFAAYTAMLLGPLEFFANLYANLQIAAASADRVYEFLDAESEIKDPARRMYFAPQRPPAVRFEEVSFSYPSEQPTYTLSDISFDVQPGWRVALVGGSGAGKSTLMNLLSRFYDPQQGQILIDGQDIREVTVRSLRRAIGIVPQEPVLFTGTIWENILYGRRDAPEAEVRAAARAANAEEFILELPNGYETIVGERGVGISGGQIQRIAIARAFLKDPAVLILDEATSNLDAVSESLVLEALERLAQGRTTFMIAHRLSTARHADLIVVMQDGRIVELGRHGELLAADGMYHELWARQMAGVSGG